MLLLLKYPLYSMCMSEDQNSRFEKVALERGQQMEEFRRAEPFFDGKYGQAGLKAKEAVSALREVGVPVDMAEKAVVQKVTEPASPLAPPPIETVPMYKIPQAVKEKVKADALQAITDNRIANEQEILRQKEKAQEALIQSVSHVNLWRTEEEYEQSQEKEAARWSEKLRYLMPWRWGKKEFGKKTEPPPAAKNLDDQT